MKQKITTFRDYEMIVICMSNYNQELSKKEVQGIQEVAKPYDYQYYCNSDKSIVWLVLTDSDELDKLKEDLEIYFYAK